MTQKIVVSCALASIALTSLAAAQATPGPRRAEPVDNPSVQRALEQSHAGYQEFLARSGGAWSVHFDEAAGTPDSIVGSGLPVAGGGIKNLPEAAAAAAETLAKYPELWGAPIGDLHQIQAERVNRIYVFTWQQRFQGLDVRGATVQIQVHEAGRVSSIGSTSFALPADFSRLPSLSADQAVAAVSAGKRLVAGDSVEATDFLVYAKRALGASTPVLAYRVDVKQPSAKTFEIVFVDANDGSILEVAPGRYDVTDVKGQVTGLSNTSLLPLTAPVSVPLANVTVNVAGVGSTVTDVNGNYLIATAQSGPFNVSATLDGPTFDVTPLQGAAIVANGTTSNVGGAQVADLLFNSAPSQFTSSQSTGAYLHNVIRAYAQAKLPTFVPWPVQHVNVNLNDTCNAYYDPADNSINFFASGGGCVNTAYSTVLYHEFGHGVDDRFGGITSGSLSEAIGDIFSMYATDQPVNGQDFFGPGTIIRTGLNNTTWPASGCGGEVHCVGETFMGYAWRARVNLGNSLGTPAGLALAEQLFLGTLPFNNGTITTAVTQTFLNDDNDGDLTNGTPHYSDLAAAATQKGFTPPEILTINIAHTAHPDTFNQTQPLAIYANITSLTAATITTVRVEFALGSSTLYTPVFAFPTGVPNQWLANIPAQVGPQNVSYRIVATNSDAQSRTVPTGDDAFRFAVGRQTQLFFDNLESGAPGWTHTLVATQDDWDLGDPQTLGSNNNDPVSPFSGTKCWGNDLQVSSASQNGNYGNNVDNYLESPSINASGHTGVRVRFRRWLTVQNANSDQATVSVNGVQSWQNPTTGNLLDTTWTLQDVPGSGGDNNAAFKVRWRLDTNSSTTFGGWTVDDIQVYTNESTPVVSLNLTPSSPTPPLGSILTISMNGTPGAGWSLYVSGNAGPTSIPGFGVVGVGSDAAFLLAGTLNGSGNDAFVLPIPNIPILSGLKIYWVGAGGTGGSLPQISNSVLTTLQ